MIKDANKKSEGIFIETNNTKKLMLIHYNLKSNKN